MRTITALEDKKAGVVEKEVPKIEDDEVLVKVVAVALNPTDWKHLEFISPPGVTIGCDFSGVVEKAGSKVTGLKVGEKIGGFVHGSKFTHTGAFAEYTTAIADLCWKKPAHLSHEENATFGVGGLTAAFCLFYKLNLSAPLKPSGDKEPLLVWAGSTSVGQFAIQLAALAGFTVITTASPKNHELVKSLGATHAFDYKDPDVVKKIKEATNNKLAYAVDCISEQESQTKVAESLGEKGGKVVVILAPIEKKPREDVEYLYTLLYTVQGRAFSIRGKEFPAAPQDREFIRNFIQTEYNRILQDKKVKGNVLKKMDGGLEKIPEGLAYLKSGQASAEKLVYHIQNE